MATRTEKVNEVTQLKNRVEELTKQLQMLMNMQQVKQVTKNIADDNDEDDVSINISRDEYIKVMSLCPHELNLATEPRGRGKIFTFKKFGEVKRILYADLIHLMENHNNFLEDGVFIIMNKKIIRRHGLDDAYMKLLTKENFDRILSQNDSDAFNLFKNANPRQQEYIVQFFVKKGIDGEAIDLNFVDRMSRVIGYSIQEKIESAKKTVEILNIKRE